MESPRYAFDADDLLFDLNRPLGKFHNAKYGTNYSYRDIHSFELETIWKCSFEECIRRLTEFFATPDFQRLRRMYGARTGLQQIKDSGAELFVITSRPHIVSDITHQTIQKGFPGIFSSIHLTNSFGEGQRRAKWEVCQALGVSTLVDDHYTNVKEVAEHNMRGILMRRPWNMKFSNKEVRAAGVEPVTSWRQVTEKLVCQKP